MIEFLLDNILNVVAPLFPLLYAVYNSFSPFMTLHAKKESDFDSKANYSAWMLPSYIDN